MAKESQAQKDRAEHQAKLATSGYRLPDNFYVDTADNAQSAEKKSGDGGQAANDISPEDSEHGYKGELQSREEATAEVRAKSLAGRAGIDNKSAAGGSTVKFASKGAEEAGRAGGITAEEYAANPASGANGYTKGEVDAIVAARP